VGGCRFWTVLLIPQILISAYGWQRPRALWPLGDGHNRVVGALMEAMRVFGIVLSVAALNAALAWTVWSREQREP
jgi:hypothetical protein